MGDSYESFSKPHGRFERRRVWTSADPDVRFALRDRAKWAGVTPLVNVTAERTVGPATSVETRFFLSSLPHTAQPLAAAVRGHWGIENRLHWVLAIAFREDDSRLRK
ncbi:MAG TPA: ISAs1 family transposase [Chloroflexi bacterium]|nr:ISAs1 family transposase [Chloroflexota bacterium]